MLRCNNDDENTDYWCFGSRYPRSTRNNNLLILLPIDLRILRYAISNTQCTPLVDGQGRNLFPFLQAIDDWETNRWAVVSWFFNDRSIVALSIRLFSSSSKRLTPFVCHHQALFPALEKPILSLIDRSNASSETDGSRRNRRDRVELAETAYERRYRHCTIEWNDRSDCFVLSNDSQTGRLRVTWTSMATGRLGLAGNTSFRLSGIWIFQFFCSL